ncbi:hypothetical protein CUMW_167090 [Citrus unshiu]|uniref:Uncharacterized protein n=1 Tax=Citrus unshiu TaxID=55188 RepID=A0A2H5PTY3_CITUN|nr:hypothetical protein CUMW_167090 [Citrus unshiu]
MISRENKVSSEKKKAKESQQRYLIFGQGHSDKALESKRDNQNNASYNCYCMPPHFNTSELINHFGIDVLKLLNSLLNLSDSALESLQSITNVLAVSALTLLLSDAVDECVNHLLRFTVARSGFSISSSAIFSNRRQEISYSNSLSQEVTISVWA